MASPSTDVDSEVWGEQGAGGYVESCYRFSFTFIAASLKRW